MIRIANCTKDEFERRTRRGNLVVFTAGKMQKEFCAEYGIENIAYVVDNFKKGLFFYAGNSVPIIDINTLKKFPDLSKYMFIIPSNNFAEELLRQLDVIEEFDDLVFFCPYLLTKDEKHICIKKTGKGIPKIIHYCWFGKNELPEEFKRNIDSWEKNMPDYEIVKWDETNYNVKKNRYISQAYDKKMWGFVSDYARIDVINEMGGIYFDTDVEVVRSFTDLLETKLFCGFQNKWSVAFGLGFGAEANHPALEQLINWYDEMEFVDANGEMNLKLCPYYQTEVLKEFGLKTNGKSQQTNDFLALSTEYFSPFNPWGLGEVTQYTYSIHQYVGTWAGKTANNNDEKRKKFFEEHLINI